MSATTMSAILARFATVLEAAPLSLVTSSTPFDVKDVPNDLVNTTYRLLSGGLIRDDDQSNYSTARVERVTVTVMQRMDFDAYQAQQDLSDLLDDIELAIIAEGNTVPLLGIRLEKGSRKVVRPKDSDIVEATLGFMVDYDFVLS